ncbi:unnamed protein product [Symbiodinium natans]|uniref:Uncharacterized protein n=1 Tax=Symbiodinium natans TaxID=878477 RepID=A0A812T9T5_9DINO|nr:unnamed protein product [Symbiodinium natans]
MESDTLPYDGDGAAWEGWQVPAYSTSGCKNQAFEVGFKPPQAENDAVAPTIPYDTVFDMGPEVDDAAMVGDATLAYEAGPGEVPEVSTLTSMPPPALSHPAPASEQEAPTLAYGDTLVLHPEDADQAVPEADAQRPSCASSNESAAAPDNVTCKTDAAATKSGLRLRLWCKQPPPTGYVPPALASRPPAKARASAPAKRPAPAAEQTPKLVGCRVAVTGDGWGGGIGGYEATVVDSDDLSLTVIFRDDDKKWKETHVLRQHCELIDAPQPEVIVV